MYAFARSCVREERSAISTSAHEMSTTSFSQHVTCHLWARRACAARLTRLRCRVQNESKFGRQVEFLPGSAPTSEFIEKLHCLPHGTVDQAPLQCAQFKSPGANHFYTVGLTLSGALSLQARSILMYNIELKCISTCDFYMYRKYTGEHD